MTELERLEVELKQSHNQYIKPILNQIENIKLKEFQGAAKRLIGRCFKRNNSYFIILDFLDDIQNQRIKVFEINENIVRENNAQVNIGFYVTTIGYHYFSTDNEITKDEFLEVFKRVTYRLTSLLHEIKIGSFSPS